MSSPFLRVPLALLALVVSALVLAACGGSDSEDPQAVLKETFSGSKEVTSGNLNVELDLKVQGNPQLSQPVTIKLSGPFQSQGKAKIPKFDLNLAFSGGGQSIAAGAVSTGTAGYLEFQNQAYEVPRQVFDQFVRGYEQAQKQNQGNNNQSFASLGLNPLNWLKDPKTVGTEEVGGAETVHVSSSVDVPKLVQDFNKLLGRAGQLGVQGSQQVPTEITPEQQRQITQALKNVKFDVWSGTDDKILRKMTIDLGVAARGQSGTLKLTIEIADLNEEQDIQAPANPKPLSELQGQLGGLGGGLGGLGGGAGGSGGSTPGATVPPATTPPGSSGGGSGSPGSSEALQKYSQCLQEAGGDAAKAQQCADLLTP